MTDKLKKINKGKILITGGNGLVGRGLIGVLKDRYEIICLNRTGQRPLDKNMEYVKGDITDDKIIDKAVGRSNIIIHLAGGGGNPACAADPVWAVKTHILGAALLLKKALKYKIKKFIFASSQSVYTTFHERVFPFEENINLEPDDFYGLLKKSAEDLIGRSGVNYTILRFANIYGKSALIQQGGAVNNFINSALAGSEMKIYGSGEQGIDYVNLRDVIRAIILAVEEKKQSDIYNVGGGALIKIKEIAELVRDIFKDKFNEKIKIKNLPAPADKLWPDRLMSIKKIKKDLNWRPEVSLREGLEEIIIDKK